MHIFSLKHARWTLLALAAAQRIAFRLESERLPFLDAPLFDSAVYLRQAESICTGQFDDPTLVAFGPLYGWFLALYGSMAVNAQLVLGFATAFLVERTAARRSEAAGVVALALWLGYAVPLFYETKLMSETLGLFLTAAAVFVYASPSVDRGDVRSSLATGALLALATLTRANLLFALPFFAILAMLPRQEEPTRARASRTASLVLGIVLVLVVHGGWNYSHFGRFIPVILTSRTASTASTEGEWTGSLAVFGTTDHPPTAWDVVTQAERTLAAPAASSGTPSIDLAGWLRGSPAKLSRTFSDVETTFDYGFYGERSELWSLAYQPVSMGTLLLLGLLGALVLARERGLRALAPYAPLLIGVVIVTTLFHPSTRYRLSMALPLSVLAAHAVTAIHALAPSRRRTLIASATALLCLGLAVRHLAHPLASPATWEVRVAEGEAARGADERARARIARALAYHDDAANARIEALRGVHALPPPPP